METMLVMAAARRVPAARGTSKRSARAAKTSMRSLYLRCTRRYFVLNAFQGWPVCPDCVSESGPQKADCKNKIKAG